MWLVASGAVLGTTTTAAARRPGRPPQITRDRVAEVAAKLGPTGLTVQAVADALGVTRAAIYHYVDDVEELRRLAAYTPVAFLADPADDATSWQEVLRAFARAARAWRLAHGEPYLRLTLDLPETAWFERVVDRAVARLVGAGFPERRARHAFRFLAGVVWINAQDQLSAPWPAGDPDERFAREVDWVILALERDLEELR
jgi:AcrR family transcriptional regulator